MRSLALAAAAILLSSFTASATILIYDGPAPYKGYGSEDSIRRNKAFLVLDTETSTAQMVNFFGKHRSKDFDVSMVISLDNATIPGARGSTTVATGVVRTEPQPSDFDTIVLSLRGKNALLSKSPQLVYPRVIAGIFRRTTKRLADVSHVEQRFTVRFNQMLSSAANNKNETLASAIERIKTVLENRGYQD